MATQKKAAKPKATKPKAAPKNKKTLQTAINKLNRAPAAKIPAEGKFAGKKIKALFKPEEVACRENTWTRTMVIAAITSTTTDAAQAKIAASKEFAGRKIDWSWLVAKKYLALS